jgi:hypothetical protein
MVIYRFERKGIGPFVGPTSNFVFMTRTNTRTYTKAQAEAMEQLRSEKDSSYDYKSMHSKDRLFGCKSKEQLRMYFGEYKKLFKDGYRIKRYVVPDEEVISMGGQVSFPVKYHKLQSYNGIKRAKKKVGSLY